MGKLIKDILAITSYTAIAAIATGVGTSIVMETLKEQSHSIQDGVSRNVVKSFDENKVLGVWMETQEVNSGSFKFKICFNKKSDMKVVNRYFYEIVNGESKFYYPEWDEQSRSYYHIVDRDLQFEKNVVCAIDVNFDDGSTTTIVSNDYVVKPSMVNSQFKLSIDDKNTTNTNVLVNLDIKNCKNSNDLKILFEKKYNIENSLTGFSKLYESNFSNNFSFNKENCGKYIRASLFERILVPVGMKLDGKVQYKVIDVPFNLSDEVYIYPGLFSKYKLNYSLIGDLLLLNLQFDSNLDQKEIEYEIIGWQVSENNGVWKYIPNEKSKNISDKLVIDKNLRYRVIYSLKNGEKNNLIASNIVELSALNKSYIKNNYGTLDLVLPDYIDVSKAKINWFKKELNSDSNFVEIENNNKLSLLVNDDQGIYKAVLNYENIANDYVVDTIVVKKNIVDNIVELNEIDSNIDLSIVEASTIFENANNENTRYVWGQGDTVFIDKVSKIESFVRNDNMSNYWVYAINNNKCTEKTYFNVNEAFKPNFIVNKEDKKLFVDITNENLDKDSIEYTWQHSNNGWKWFNVENNKDNNCEFDKYDSNFARVILKYKLKNDRLISNIIKL